MLYAASPLMSVLTLIAGTLVCGGDAEPRTLKGHQGSVLSVAFSHDGSILASGSPDGTARLWDANAGKLLRVLEGHTGGLECIAFSPDGKTLASSSQDSTVRLWDVETGKVRHILEGHKGEIDSVAFAPD